MNILNTLHDVRVQTANVGKSNSIISNSPLYVCGSLRIGAYITCDTLFKQNQFNAYDFVDVTKLTRLSENNGNVVHLVNVRCFAI